MKRSLRVASASLAVLSAVLLIAAPATAAPPAPGVVLSGLSTVEGTVRFTVTPRNVVTPFDPSAITVKAGQTQLSTTTAPAVKGIAARAMVVVLDASQTATSQEVQAGRDAAETVATGLPDDVQVGLVVIGPQPTTAAVRPTADRDVFVTALGARTPSGRTRLVDAVLAAKSAFDSANVPATAERRILILGATRDSGSATSTAAASAQLAAAGVLVDAIVPDDTASDTTALVQATGGRLLTGADPAGFAAAAQTEATVISPATTVTGYVPVTLAGQATTLTVGVTGTTLTATLPVTFAGSVATPVDSSAGALGWVPTWLAYAFGALFFLAVIVAVLAIVWPRSLKHERIQQIAHFGPGRTTPVPKPTTDAPAGSVIARTALAATRSVVRSGRMEERITHRLERAGMKLRAHEWVLLRACITIAAGAALFPFASVPGGLIGLAIGWLGTMLYQSVRIDRRANLFAEQLPDALQLVIGSLKSGFSLPQAFESLVRESPEPVALEFGRALSEHRLGADISDALERVAQRSESDDLGWAVMSVRIQREVGGNLAEVLQTTVDTMRERGRLRRHVRSLSAEGRLSAYVLIGLPVALGLFMFLYRRKYMTPLLTDPLGITLLAGGGLLFIAGIFWMTRVIKVEA